MRGQDNRFRLKMSLSTQLLCKMQEEGWVGVGWGGGGLGLGGVAWSLEASPRDSGGHSRSQKK